MALDKDDDPQKVELFARFGRAFYMANVVEDQLVLTLMQVEFARTKEEFVKAKGKGFDRAKIAADWDAYSLLCDHGSGEHDSRNRRTDFLLFPRGTPRASPRIGN